MKVVWLMVDVARIRLPIPDGAAAAEPGNVYASQLKQLDEELEEVCSAFHASVTLCDRAHLYAIAKAKQLSVTSILTQILNVKKASLPFLLTQDNLPRPQGLQVALLDGATESLLTAARLANKPFKRALQGMLTELNMSVERGERGRLIIGPVKRLGGIAERGATNIFDLNRATIVFESEAELRAILEALPTYFEIVYLDNKFKRQWEEATQPPCLHLNLRMKPEMLPVELTDLLAPGAGWVVELQLSMRDFLDVMQRCHTISEILRLRVECEQASGVREHKANAAVDDVEGATAAGPGMQYHMLPLPRACPKCGLLRHYVKSSQLQNLVDVSFTQKLVKKGILVTMDGDTERKLEVAYNLVAINEQCHILEDVFIREVGLLTRLDHPNVLQILGVVREENVLGFVTEWMPQGSLWKCLQDQQERQLDVWAVALQLCDALMYVHSHGVVHLDLKSKNVLLARQHLLDGRSSLVVAKLCDFGMSREVKLRRGVSVGGTPNWQAPETWNDVDSCRPSADVYAFGGVLIELFGQEVKPGCFPWMQEHSGGKRIKRQIMKNRTKPPELEFLASEPKVKALVADCLAFDPGSRPTMKKVKARLLAAHLDSVSFDSNARRVLMAMEDGTLSFRNLFAELQANGTTWPVTVSFLEKYWQVSPCFEVALAMCYFFDRKHNDNTQQASLQPRNEDAEEEKNNSKETKQGAGGKETKKTASNASDELSSSKSLFEVCERRMDEVVAAKFVAGWCSSIGTGGAIRDEDRAMRYYRQAAAQGYPAAQFQLGLFHRNAELRQRKVDEEEAVRWFMRAANRGHIGAQLTLVRCYQLGQGVGLDLSVAEDWLNRAATSPLLYQREPGQVTEMKHRNEKKQREDEVAPRHDTKDKNEQSETRKQENDLSRYLWAGECFKNGGEVEQDVAEAARLFRLAADPGDANAQYNLGMCYDSGEGVEQDMAEAVRLFRLAADQGHDEAQFSLGVCYDNGEGVQQDVAKAVRLYRLAADQGHASAQFNLGICYENGEGVEQDVAEAVRLFRLAAEQGDADAQSNLGMCYGNGQGVQQDMAEAARLFRLAAEQGDANARYNLGVCYDSGEGVEQDMAEAARLFRFAADQGHANAQFSLGVCYDNGQGVQQDGAEAARLYRLAANQGHARAQCNLGVCYDSGQGVEQDVAEAARLFRLAADQGHAEAQSNLGVCYGNGQGVQQDMAEAARLFRLGADQGDESAQYNLGVCFSNGQGVEQDMAEAVRLFRLAADQGHASAQYNLAVCYDSGQRVQQDVAEAVRLFRLLADQGHSLAQSALTRQR